MKETTVNVDEKLAVDKFNVDEGNPHIVLVEDPDPTEFEKLMLCCPAGLYQRGPEGELVFDCAGCLECGTCRILCGDTIIEKWEFPKLAWACRTASDRIDSLPLQRKALFQKGRRPTFPPGAFLCQAVPLKQDGLFVGSRLAIPPCTARRGPCCGPPPQWTPPAPG